MHNVYLPVKADIEDPSLFTILILCEAKGVNALVLLHASNSSGKEAANLTMV